MTQEQFATAASADAAGYPPASERTESATASANPLFSFSGHPGGVAVGADDSIWVSDTVSATVWRLAGDGIATSVLSPRAEAREGSITASGPRSAAGLALGPDGSLFIADSTGNRVWSIGHDGTARVVAGGASGYRDGPGTEALFRQPLDVAIAADGLCYVADTGNDRIRRIERDGSVSTVAGSIYDYGDGRGTGARFRRPGALDVDASGICYVADTGNNAIRRIAPDGTVTTLAGGPPGGDSDGTGTGIGLRWPTGIAVGEDGAVWVADYGNGALRCISSAGESHSSLRLTGLRWPVAVALRADGTPVVAGAASYDVHAPEACLMSVTEAQ